jgi:hypothetical protein
MTSNYRMVYVLDEGKLTKLRRMGRIACRKCNQYFLLGDEIENRNHNGGGKSNWPKHTYCLMEDSRPVKTR